MRSGAPGVPAPHLWVSQAQLFPSMRETRNLGRELEGAGPAESLGYAVKSVSQSSEPGSIAGCLESFWEEEVSDVLGGGFQKPCV